MQVAHAKQSLAKSGWRSDLAAVIGADGRIEVDAQANLIGLDDDNEWPCNRKGDAAPASATSGALAAMSSGRVVISGATR